MSIYIGEKVLLRTLPAKHKTLKRQIDEYLGKIQRINARLELHNNDVKVLTENECEALVDNRTSWLKEIHENENQMLSLWRMQGCQTDSVTFKIRDCKHIIEGISDADAKKWGSFD